MNTTADGTETRLAVLLRQTAPWFPETVRILVFDGRLILEGSVESYELKRRVEELVREAGYVDIANGLRVFPHENGAAKD